MAEPEFIHLRVHSAYSLSRGAIKVPAIPTLCKQNRMPAVAITDCDNLFGAMDIAKTCASSGIQHIIGSEVTFRYTKPLSPPLSSSILLLAQTLEGYRNLMKISTLSYRQENLANEGPYIIFEELAQYQSGLICLLGGDAGPVGKLLLQKENQYAESLLLQFHELFQDRLYMELMRHGTEDQQKVEPQLLDLALKHHLPIVATNDVFFAEPSMYEAHDALLCIASGRYLYEDNREKSSPQKYFKSSKEMIQLFADLPEAIENSIHIAQRCSFVLEESKPILPPFQTESGLSEKDEVETQAVAGLNLRLETQVFPHHPPEEHEALREQYFKRLRSELDVINSMGFPGYFLIVSDFIKWAKQHNIPVGPGRGSGAGSLVAWALTITDMDPIRFELIFERFLNPERVSMPDFDVDFCQDRRGEVIDYVLQKYGQEKVAQIITFGKLQARAVLRDVGRVLGMPYTQVDKVCKLVPNSPGVQVTLEEAIRLDPIFKEKIREDDTVAKLVNIALKLEGLYRHASTHAAGVVIGGQDLSEVVPLYYDGSSPLAITQINMKYIEKTGLLKFDFLGLKTLTVIQTCCQLIRKRGVEINMTTIPLEDAKTFELLCNVNVLGVFQLESGGMQDVLKRLRPDRFEDLIALVALYRPGPMDDIPKYLARKHGEEAVSYPHPKLEPILNKTYGVMVYQEQVMQIAQRLGGYTFGGADLLRRAMGKKNKEEMTQQRSIFVEGAVKNDVPKETAEHIFNLMAKFASYGFNKSHSAPYAFVSYQTAYLKANFPLEFFAATITYEKHNVDKMVTYFQDLKRNGFTLLPPDINKSEVNFVPEDGALRYALSAIKNVGEQAMQSVIANRNADGPFTSLENFATRIDPSAINKRQLENLIASGALDSLHPNRKQMFESADIIMAYANSCKQEKAAAMRSLFDDSTTKPVPLRLVQSSNDWNILEKSQKECDALGFYLNNHPLDIYKDILKQLALTNSSEFETSVGAVPVTLRIAAIVLSKEERASKSGRKFASITFSDAHGSFNLPFFSENYERIRDKIEEGMPVYIEALAKRNDEGALRLTGQNMEPLESKVRTRTLNLSVSETFSFAALKNILHDIPEDEEKTCTISLVTSLRGAKIRVQLPGHYALSAARKAAILALRGVQLIE